MDSFAKNSEKYNFAVTNNLILDRGAENNH